MGIIEQQAQEIRELRLELQEFKAFVSDYIEEYDPEIKGREAAAKFAGLSEKTLSRLVKKGIIPYKKDGRSISFSRKDLVEYKRNRRLAKSQQDTHLTTQYERPKHSRI